MTAPPETPDDDLWVVVFRPLPCDVPADVRRRRLLKCALRYYRMDPVQCRKATPEERARHARKRKKPPEETT